MTYSCRGQSRHKIRYQGISVGKHQFGTHGTCSLSYKKDQEQRGMIRGEKAKATVEERLRAAFRERRGEEGAQCDGEATRRHKEGAE